ncbi:hypothetical protein D3C72_1315050 [compost metagenome]
MITAFWLLGCQASGETQLAHPCQGENMPETWTRGFMVTTSMSAFTLFLLRRANR